MDQKRRKRKEGSESIRRRFKFEEQLKIRFVTTEELLDRISINPRIMVGKPVIKGTRLTVEYILGLLAHGTTFEEILAEYPGLVKDDIYACLLFASRTLQDASFIPIETEAA